MEPDRVVQARGEEHLVQDLLGLVAHRVRPHHGIGGEVVGEVGESRGVHDEVLGQVLADPEPRRRSAGSVAPGRSEAVGGDERALEHGAPRVLVELVGTGHVGRQGHRLDVLGPLGPLEAGLQVQDGTDRLTGHDAAGAERSAVADAIDLVADRFVVVAPADEVGADRVDVQLGVLDGRAPRRAVPGRRSGRRTDRPTGTAGRCRRTRRGRGRPGPGWCQGPRRGSQVDRRSPDHASIPAGGRTNRRAGAASGPRARLAP